MENTPIPEQVTQSEVNRLRRRLDALHDKAYRLTEGKQETHKSKSPDYSTSTTITISLSSDKSDRKNSVDQLQIIVADRTVPDRDPDIYDNPNHYTFTILYAQNGTILMRANRNGEVAGWLPGDEDNADLVVTDFTFTEDQVHYKTSTNTSKTRSNLNFPLDNKGRHLLRTALAQMEGAIEKCQTRIDVKTPRGTLDESGNYQ